MLIISKNINTAELLPVNRHKAPRNSMYHIRGINVTNRGATGTMVILDREVDPSRTVLPEDGALMTVELSAVGSNHFVSMDHITKYLTVGRVSATTYIANYQIYGNIIRASRKELIIEWFRGGWR